MATGTRLAWVLAAVASLLTTVSAETRTSASYAIATESQDAGGHRVSSANYSADSSIGAIGGVSTIATPPVTIKSGFAGQLYDPVGLSIGASPTNVNEGTTRQLAAAQTMDDGTALALSGSGVAWSVLSGPVNSVSVDGLATAAWVYKNTPAAMGGSAGGFSNTLGLVVINVTQDDFGLYAGDGIDDDWQVAYFGEENPEAGPGKDPDRDGRDNFSESMALTVPTDPSSLFQLRARQTHAQPGSVDLVFGPIRTGRNYTVQYSLDLSPSGWGELTGGTQGDNDEERTVTDPGASGPRKFYRVQIGR